MKSRAQDSNQQHRRPRGSCLPSWNGACCCVMEMEDELQQHDSVAAIGAAARWVSQVLSGLLLVLSGLAMAASMVGLALAMPVFLLFSPVLVPATLLNG